MADPVSTRTRARAAGTTVEVPAVGDSLQKRRLPSLGEPSDLKARPTSLPATAKPQNQNLHPQHGLTSLRNTVNSLRLALPLSKPKASDPSALPTSVTFRSPSRSGRTKELKDKEKSEYDLLFDDPALDHPRRKASVAKPDPGKRLSNKSGRSSLFQAMMSQGSLLKQSHRAGGEEDAAGTEGGAWSTSTAVPQRPRLREDSLTDYGEQLREGLDCFDCIPSEVEDSAPVTVLVALNPVNATAADPNLSVDPTPSTDPDADAIVFTNSIAMEDINAVAPLSTDATPVCNPAPPPEASGWRDFDAALVDEEFPMVPSPPPSPCDSPRNAISSSSPLGSPGSGTGRPSRKKDSLRRETLLFTHEEGGLSQGLEEAGGVLLTVLRGALTIGIDLATLLLAGAYHLLPAAVKSRVVAATPLAEELGLWLEVTMALLLLGLEVLAELLVFIWRKIQPLKPGLLLFALGGLVVALFGGYFSLTIAAVEAFKLCGYSSTLVSFQVVCADVQRYLQAQREAKRREEEERLKREQRRSARLALKARQVEELGAEAEDGAVGTEDDDEDLPWLDPATTSGTGAQLGHGHILQQVYALLSHVDPQHLSEVVMGVNKGFISVLTTLKVQFAKTITLGNALAASLDPPLRALLLPRLQGALPDGLRRWAPYIFRYALRCGTIYVAYRLSRVIACYHSAFRGGQMCALYTGKYLVATKRIHRHTLDGAMHWVMALGYAIAALGLVFQLLHVYVPFPLNVVLFPVTVVEAALLWVVNQSFYFLPTVPLPA